MTNKAALLEKIADMVNDKKIDGIADLRDESDRDGIRLVIELKRDAIPALVQNNLWKKTALQVTFSGNMLALVDAGKQPQRLTLRSALDVFIAYRFQTLRRRTKFQLKKLTARNHIVEGMILAMNRMDDIINLLRKTKESTESIKAQLCGPPGAAGSFGLSNEQADAILNMQLRRLTALEEDKLREENKDLLRQMKLLSGVMEDDKMVFDIMRQETLELKAKHAQPRRSVLWNEEGSLSEEDLVANDRSVIVITRSGYIKRVSIEEFETQARGTKGKAGARLSADDDSVSQFFSCNDHDVILFITDKGKAYSVKAFQVPAGSRIAKGVPIPQVLPINSDEIVTSVIPVDSFGGRGEDEHLVLLTSNGYVKKTPLKAFETISARGLIIISLEEADSLRWARRCMPNEEVLIATR
jgi:DNA gyrase subunit A